MEGVEVAAAVAFSVAEEAVEATTAAVDAEAITAAAAAAAAATDSTAKASIRTNKEVVTAGSRATKPLPTAATLDSRNFMGKVEVMAAVTAAAVAAAADIAVTAIPSVDDIIENVA